MMTIIIRYVDGVTGMDGKEQVEKSAVDQT